MSNPEGSAMFKHLPKIELHLHLEGAIPIQALWKLADKYGESSKIGSIKKLEQQFRFVDFSHFRDTFIWVSRLLREYEDFTFIAGKVAKDLAAQNIRYVEAFYSLGVIERQGLEVQKVTEAIRKGLDAHSDEIIINLVPDLARDYGPQQGMIWLNEIKELKDLGVIGIGIGGTEKHHPPEPYAQVFERARNFGFRTSAHAGETVGPKSIWGAINALKVDRIGHGIRAIEDANLVDYLYKKQIPIEVCPTSNLRLGIVTDVQHHPIKPFFDRGLMVTVNSDDPTLFNSSLEEEYRLLYTELGFTLSDIKKLIRNGIQSAWCSNTTKETLQRYFATSQVV
jgi:adenosine deaminase